MAVTSAVGGKAPSSPRLMRERRAVLGAVRSWGYQLRIRDLAPLTASATDLLVIDHGWAARHLGKTEFDAAEIATLKTRPDGGRRVVLSYLSIGEAEQYRFYWQAAWCRRASAPAFVGTVNPNWPGNYPVRFWDPAWQSVILDPVDGYLARIQAQGFDGIYLDRADVYSEWTKEQPRAKADMVTFLSAIAAAARAHDPNFLVVMQNAEELLADAKVRRLLDGVAKEDLLYGIKFTEDANAASDVASARTDLARARADTMAVFAVEYIADPAKIAVARRRLTDFGFVPTFAPRLLDRLGTAPDRNSEQLAPQAVPAAEPAAASTQDWAEGGPTCLKD